jgi:undecaprenyl-phosphate glucose phosphotransferase
LLKDVAVSRFFLFTFFPLLYFTFLFSHQLIPRILVAKFFSKRHHHRALLVGPLDKARTMERWCAWAMALGVDVCSLPQEWELGPGLSLGAVNDLEEIIRRERIDQIVLLELPSSRKTCRDIVSLCNRLGIRLLVVNNLPELFDQGVSFFTLDGIGFIQVRDEPLESPVNRLLKRGLDIAISIPVVVFFLPPLALVIAILHRFQSPGPLFYLQTRAGMSRRPFRIVKFRTMHVRARQAAKQATENDARVFCAGRWLRRSSLDEIPQFLNVLRGEMSVVGPRPHMIVHERRFCHALNSYHVRNFVKPGITGLAQIKGFRGEATEKAALEGRVKYDIEYLEHWSLWRDIMIVLETSKQIFFPAKSAY